MIRIVVLAAVQSLAAAAPAAPTRGATLCLDQLGINLGATCRTLQSSLISSRPDVCQCLNTGLTVIAPYCARGERPQAETADYDRARYAAARADGALAGKTYKGRSFCVAAP